jgi:hypothetical protein
MSELIPRNNAAFLKFARGIVEHVDPASRYWSHVPENAYDDLTEAVKNFEEEFNNTPTDSTREQITRRNTARKECERVIRYFIRFYVRYPSVPASSLSAMGIPPIDTVRTSHTNVTETVDFSIHIRGTNNLRVDFWQEGSPNKARPRGYSGAVIIWTLSDEEPQSNDDYAGHTLATRTPYTIEFDTHDSGKRCWIRVAWQNARGILGRFSEAQSAIVP